MKRMLLLLGLISAATGCFSVPRTPPDLVSIRCDTVDSARVAVPYAELIRVNDQVVLVGKVGRVYWGPTRARRTLTWPCTLQTARCCVRSWRNSRRGRFTVVVTYLVDPSFVWYWSRSLWD